MLENILPYKSALQRLKIRSMSGENIESQVQEAEANLSEISLVLEQFKACEEDSRFKIIKTVGSEKIIEELESACDFSMKDLRVLYDLKKGKPEHRRNFSKSMSSCMKKILWTWLLGYFLTASIICCLSCYYDNSSQNIRNIPLLLVGYGICYAFIVLGWLINGNSEKLNQKIDNEILDQIDSEIKPILIRVNDYARNKFTKRWYRDKAFIGNNAMKVIHLYLVNGVLKFPENFPDTFLQMKQPSNALDIASMDLILKIRDIITPIKAPCLKLVYLYLSPNKEEFLANVLPEFPEVSKQLYLLSKDSNVLCVVLNSGVESICFKVETDLQKPENDETEISTAPIIGYTRDEVIDYLSFAEKYQQAEDTEEPQSTEEQKGTEEMQGIQ